MFVNIGYKIKTILLIESLSFNTIEQAFKVLTIIRSLESY